MLTYTLNKSEELPPYLVCKYFGKICIGLNHIYILIYRGDIHSS